MFISHETGIKQKSKISVRLIEEKLGAWFTVTLGNTDSKLSRGT